MQVTDSTMKLFHGQIIFVIEKGGLDTVKKKS